MKKKEIAKLVRNKIKEVGVKDAYKYFVLENAKVMKPQFKHLITEYDKAMFVNLSHSITVTGFKNANVLNLFSSLFFMENVLEDEVWDYVFPELVEIADN